MESKKLSWLANFAAKLADSIGIAGITAEDAAGAQEDHDAFKWMVIASATMRAKGKALNAFKREIAYGRSRGADVAYPAAPIFPPAPTPVAAGIFDRVFALAERIKAAADYTRAIGKNLGIEPPERSDDLGIPRFRAAAMADGSVRVKFFKGRASGVRAQRQRNDETEWRDIGRFYFTPFFDRDEPLEAGRPEVRRYRLQYLKRDQPVGDLSQIVTVTTVV